jgi:hypothetical protein
MHHRVRVIQPPCFKLAQKEAAVARCIQEVAVERQMGGDVRTASLWGVGQVRTDRLFKGVSKPDETLTWGISLFGPFSN